MSGPKEGSSAAPFELPLVGASAARFRLDEQRGKPVLIEVFASWCGACQRSAPVLAEASRKHQQVVFLGVSVDGSPEEAARVKADWQIPYPVALDDGSMSKSYKVEVLPTLVLVDRAGQIQRVATGIPSSSTLESWLAEL
jgi:thiol-disulfide isomerase/thioredoxin